MTHSTPPHNLRPHFCVADLLLSALRHHGNKPAIVTNTRSLTYAELDRESDLLAKYLQMQGVQPGDRIALHLRNCCEYVVGDIAILKLGAIKVPLNELMGAEEISYCLEHSGTSVLVRHESLKLPATMPTSVSVRIDLPEGCKTSPWPIIEEANSSPFNRVPVDSSDTAMIAYTGGTTGKPKGVVHSQFTLAVNQFAHIVCGEIESDECMLLTTPLPHSAGYHLQACLIQGGKVIIDDQFAPQRFIETCQSYNVTWTFAVPTMIYRLLDHLSTLQQPAPSLRTFVYGAAPMSVERLNASICAFGPIFIQLYGQTECPNFITRLSKEDHENERLLASCGKPVPFVEVTIRNEGSDDNEVGEIEVSSPYNLIEYFDNPEATKSTLVDGKLRTGDLARLDEDGFVFLIDRAKDMIITGGMNVYCVEVEQVIRRHPLVRDAAVVGLPDSDWGERVVAAVSTYENVDAESIRQFARERLSGYKSPKEVHILDTIPLTAYGKIDKKALRKTLSPAEAVAD